MFLGGYLLIGLILGVSFVDKDDEDRVVIALGIMCIWPLYISVLVIWSVVDYSFCLKEKIMTKIMDLFEKDNKNV